MTAATMGDVAQLTDACQALLGVLKQKRVVPLVLPASYRTALATMLAEISLRASHAIYSGPMLEAALTRLQDAVTAESIGAGVCGSLARDVSTVQTFLTTLRGAR